MPTSASAQAQLLKGVATAVKIIGRLPTSVQQTCNKERFDLASWWFCVHNSRIDRMLDPTAHLQRLRRSFVQDIDKEGFKGEQISSNSSVNRVTGSVTCPL